MPPATTHPPPAASLLTLTLTLTLISLAESAESTESTHPLICTTQTLTPHHCPPFPASSPPPFPFSASPNCNHPAFPVACASPHSLLSINNLSFSLLQYRPPSSILVAAALPSRPLNLSGTPFRLSDAACSRLALLKPCAHASPPNCSGRPFLCELFKSPIRLFLHGCADNRTPLPEQTCQTDVIDFLRRFLAVGVGLVWDENLDPYYTQCGSCRSRNGSCGFNSSDPERKFVCFVDPIEIRPPWIRHKVAVLASLFTLVCLICFLVMMVWNYNKPGSVNSEDPTALFLNRHRTAGLLPPVFTYDELESSTNRFDSKRKIGDGGFGSVFLGRLPDNRVVAVKQLHQRLAGTKSFCNEILILSSIDHPNLVKLHGYCSDPRGLLLVYDYIPNGTLAEHLHGNRSLYRNGSMTWQVRLDIAMQIATAIEYLHFSVQPPVVHRDITTANIFVEKDLRVKLGDFGLSRLLALPEKTEESGPESEGFNFNFKNNNNKKNSGSTGFVWTGPQGTPGYLDPDYYRSFQLTEKSDVYSFGVVLLELVTGMKAVDGRRERREVALAEMAVARIQMGVLWELVDPVLGAVQGNVVKESVGAVAELAFRCVAVDKDDRPDSREVAAEVRRIWSRNRGVKGGGSGGVVVPEA